MRILITGTNDNIPANAMQRCAVPATLRVTSSITSPPARQPGANPSPAYLAAESERRAAIFLPGPAPQLGPHLSARAFSFDATADRWITPPPGMTPVAGAAADLRPTHAAHKRSSAVPLEAGERPPHPVVEMLTVALGLTVFGLIAGFFLVLS